MNDQTTTTGTASPLKRSVLKGKARASLLGHYMPLSSAFLSLAILQYIITVSYTHLTLPTTSRV